ncbi:hypothetical protein FOC1_g10006186 [Fusarium oxysporum f. sp. cubense race 1]|uniref:Quinate/shikimate 5-dehydrogenase/glutamyl-tRNA reductase domain-containing protein n=1 Tax=Fusarium oxysporum f. sp. cubense (strain race 1) TaxID=1229664 RepID=N4U821_FUSC1|nr:hypothetical protein FOC1_g10006186 [Fusarium oxysporum f. sp. cubense race 1]
MSHTLLALDNSIIHDLLISLSRADIVRFQRDLENSLIEFSAGNEGKFQLNPDFINRPNGQKTIFRTFTSPDAVGMKIIVTPAPVESPNGNTANPPLNGLLNAAEVTGFRTTLCALIPWTWRRHTENIVIFGTGKQGLWHTRLALALRGSEIKSVTIINRSVARAQSLVAQVTEENQKYWKSSLDPSQPDYSKRLAAVLSTADAVFCTVGSTSPLFSFQEVLRGTRSRLPFISAIGSWQSDMMELDPELLRYAAGRPDSYSPRGASGSIIVDDAQEFLVKSGEVMQSGLKAEQMLQVGEILNWQQEKSGLEGQDRERLASWLADGFVVYEGVGVSVTDLAAGNAILEIAKDRNVGVSIANF